MRRTSGFSGLAATALAATLGLSGCGGKFALPSESPGGVIPEKGSYQYTGSVLGLPGLTDVLLTLGSGSTVYVVYDSNTVEAYPRVFRSDGTTPELGYRFPGPQKPVHVCQGPARIFVLDAGDTTLAKTDPTRFPKVFAFGVTGGAAQLQFQDTSWADVRGIAADAGGNVYVSCVARVFVRDDPQDPRRQTFKFSSRVYRYLAAQGFARDDRFFVDEGQGQGSVFEPGDCFVLAPGGTPYLYVADTGKDLAQRLLIQDNAGEPLPALVLDGGETGTVFAVPVDMIADPAGFMYVVDRGNRRVLRYEPGGAFVQKVNVELDLHLDSLHVPVAVAGNDSLAYVADRQTGKLHSYKKRK